MIKATNLSFSFPQKDLYEEVSFSIEENRHCAFIGGNGTGKSTLVDLIRHPQDYLYDGRLEIDPLCRIGYVSQFSQLETAQQVTVFDYMSEEFVRVQKQIDDLCEQMGTTEDLKTLLEQYQQALDLFGAMDGEHYESNIRKQLKLAGLKEQEQARMDTLSGGEYKLVQVMKEMITAPKLLIMDEPDGFLDFKHLTALKDLINFHRGTLLIITHNRFLLHHCFDQILHLEGTKLEQFDGSYLEYNFSLLQRKIEQQEQAAADLEEIERNRRLVDKLRNEATAIDSATKGRTLHARVTMLQRLEERRTKDPFVDICKPDIVLRAAQEITDESMLELCDYEVGFEHVLLEHVDVQIQAGEKVAIVGENGAGKTTLLRDLYLHDKETIHLNERAEIAYLSQRQGEVLPETATVIQVFEEAGLESEAAVAAYLQPYGFSDEILSSQIREFSGGEKTLLQLAKIACTKANLLLLDEPTSHLDTYAQLALEEALADYNGTVVMVSHDFYTIANCMDYVLFIEEKGIRRIRIRKFRQMIYQEHFDKNYLQLEQQKKELEHKVALALQAGQFEEARIHCEKLEKVVKQM